MHSSKLNRINFSHIHHAHCCGIVTFERCDHAWTPLLQEGLQLLPSLLQYCVVLYVAAQVFVVLFEQTVPGPTDLQPVGTKHTQ